MLFALLRFRAKEGTPVFVVVGEQSRYIKMCHENIRGEGPELLPRTWGTVEGRIPDLVTYVHEKGISKRLRYNYIRVQAMKQQKATLFMQLRLLDKLRGVNPCFFVNHTSACR